MKTYIDKRGVEMGAITAYVPFDAWRKARERRMNISGICSDAIVTAVKHAEFAERGRGAETAAKERALLAKLREKYGDAV